MGRLTVYPIPFFTIFTLFLLSGFAYGDIRIHSHTFDPTELTVGDVFRLRLLIEADADLQLELEPMNAGQLQYIEVKAPQIKQINARKLVLKHLAGKGRFFYELSYPLQVFAPGEHTLPPVAIGYRHPNGDQATIQTPAYTFAVKSVNRSKTQTLKQIKPPRPAPIPLAVYLLVPLLVIILLASSALLYLRRRAKAAPPSIEIPPQRLPHEVASERLLQIEEQNLVERGQFKLYHIQLSLVIRQYLNDRYHIPAVELTTDDLLEALRREEIQETHLRLIQEFLTACNLVKYAKHVPSEPEAHTRLAEAQRVIDVTKGIPVVH